LNFPLMSKFLREIDILVHRKRPMIYAISIAFAIVSVIGIWQLRSVSYMVDDVPEESQVKKDLKFFEANFSGIMPLEVVVEFVSKKRRPILSDLKNLQKVEEFEQFLDSLPMVSKPVSLLSFVKASKQAFYNNNPDRYALPTKSEGAFIMRYMKGQSDKSGLFKSFVDSAFTKMRISSQNGFAGA
jgi:uncharacterized protein